jgi:dihydropyrimidinase
MREYGVWSYKFFTNFRGNEGKYLGVEGTDDGFLYRYLRTIGQHRGAVACVHAENIEVVWQLQKELQAAGRDDLAAWDESRPDWVEADYIHSTLLFASRVAAPTYVVHVTAELCLEEIRVARKRWPALPIYAETCPHYLTHTADMIMEPRALGKVNPPLRHRADVDALWEAVADGTIDTIGSDHVPRGKEKKGGAIWSASAGFPATGALLPVLLSEGLHKRGVPIERIVALTSYNPARIFGLYPRKGAIAPGSDADLVIVDPNLERVVEPSTFQSRADYSLYDDWTLKGWPILTMVRGQVVARDGHLAGAPGRAQYLPREATPI